MPKVYLSWLIYSITNSVTSIININTEHVIFGILVACYGQQCFTISIMKYGAHFFSFWFEPANVEGQLIFKARDWSAWPL